MTARDDISMRRADPEDFAAIVNVCGEALHWSGEGRDAAFFEWKHQLNPFGPSPIWVAEHDGGIVGVRAMMRWELHRPDSGIRRMARAVDTATLPAFQGRGIFSRLTSAAVEELTAERVAAIFNTPNDQSRPGYLKLGWSELGRVPVKVRLRSPLRLPLLLPAIARSRTAADKWGLPTTVGLDPAGALADDDEVEALLRRCQPAGQWSTPLSVGYLRWRTGFDPLACRVQPIIGPSLSSGLMVFRLRQRGGLRQLSLLHLVAPAGSGGACRRAIGRLLADTGADVVLASGTGVGMSSALVPLPRGGPLLTWRPLAETDQPDISEVDLPLGALELF
jgi:GNAT superfamily N-acetyltransferase